VGKLISMMVFACVLVAGGAYLVWTYSGPPGANAGPSPAQVAYAADAVPEDTDLAAIYDRSCRACHSLASSGAPLTGHGTAWRSRIAAKGLDGLVAAARTGTGNMPAMGLCADCRDGDFENLIQFMAREGS